ncbi:uncharacterized protein BT62DRAFT_899502 [Guyanagaster necrorhizus]|uniref:Protein ARV n=1 Tax=Guyanagaster necrorhizus TaxID=856835 RepID=A0A9P7VRP8_9AGAR|nr:uncharacterized protein BT62DRAFT_899502 [Guyanagaster necrorhizus MCA 3950]KAG7444746.1 hypothetical protein BT62DRAFT_899502 [Guyanagaster necrorhizus MCA 3950]
MPICTTCTRWSSHLYTVYESASNLRLERCSNCHAFVDPYIEYDDLILLIDLILLKSGVYRHLLFNRGAKPRLATEASPKDDDGRRKRGENSRWLLVLHLGSILIFVDAFNRWCHLNPSQSVDLSPWSGFTIFNFSRIFIGCFAETVAFHCGVAAAYSVVLKMITLIEKLRQRHTSNIVLSSYSLIPLTLFYSSLTKLFLSFLLTIWRPSRSELLSPTAWNAPKLSNFLNMLDDSQLDIGWIVRNILGGISAGFGLRVILDCHPVFIMLVIFCGSVAKTVMAVLVSQWVGEAWLGYSLL